MLYQNFIVISMNGSRGRVAVRVRLEAGAEAAEQLEVAVDVDAPVGLAALALHALEVEVRVAELQLHVPLLTRLRRLARVQRACIRVRVCAEYFYSTDSLDLSFELQCATRDARFE